MATSAENEDKKCQTHDIRRIVSNKHFLSDKSAQHKCFWDCFGFVCFGLCFFGGEEQSAGKEIAEFSFKRPLNFVSKVK